MQDSLGNTLSLADGRTATDDFRLLVQPPPGATAGALFDGGNPASRVYAYQANGPWATQLERYAGFGLVEMGVFIAVLLLGLIYAWKKGVLRWV